MDQIAALITDSVRDAGPPRELLSVIDQESERSVALFPCRIALSQSQTTRRGARNCEEFLFTAAARSHALKLGTFGFGGPVAVIG
jgi:hypothetical protein